VANGVVYFGSGDGDVYALDSATGDLRWKFKTGDVVHASPALAEGVLFFGSWDSYFYAVDAATGKEKWRFHGGEDPTIHNQVGFQSSPAVAICSGIFRSRNPSKTTPGCLPVIESSMCPFFIIPTGVKRRS
jgi:outer membrane protein assembly factor BamB